jgi:hypothetical protein
MTVEKSLHRSISSITYGKINVVESILACPSGCREPSGKLCRERSPELAMLVARGANYCYDVEVFVGVQRFIHHHQRQEIRAMLAEIACLNISDGEISTLETRFLEHFTMLHTMKAEALKGAMRNDGGYPMHIDATCEDGRGTTLVIYAGWRGWVLGAWKIPSEREEVITPCIKETEAIFGPPMSYISDLGKGMMRAVSAAASTSAAATAPLVFVCHTHFVKAVGKEILGKDHDRLTASLRALEVKSRLGSIVKQIGHKLCGHVSDVRIDIVAWAEKENVPPLPDGLLGIGIARMICQWVLDYVADCGGLRFPFALPPLCLLHRCELALQAITNIRTRAVFDYGVARWFERIQGVLQAAVSDPSVRRAAKALEQKARIFAGFRSALRLDSCRPSGICHPDASDAVDEAKTLERIKTCIEDYCSTIRERYSGKLGTKAELAAMQNIITYMDKYGQYLWGHAVLIEGGNVRVVARTNNELESFHGGYKHGERRRSGRKCLTHDLESAPPAAMLVLNLNNADYVNEICGGKVDNLQQLFAEIDQMRWRDQGDAAGRVLPEKSATRTDDAVSTALPLADKRLVRAGPITQMLLSAASINIPPITDDRVNAFLGTVEPDGIFNAASVLPLLTVEASQWVLS